MDSNLVDSLQTFCDSYVWLISRAAINEIFSFQLYKNIGKLFPFPLTSIFPGEAAPLSQITGFLSPLQESLNLRSNWRSDGLPTHRARLLGKCFYGR